MIKRLIKADCFDVLPLIAERSIALVLTDFPYGVTKCEWDSLPDLARFWDLTKPLLIPGAPVVSTATQPFTTTLINSNVGWFKYCWIWDKHIPRGFQNAKHRPMQQHEDIVVFAKGAHNYYPIMTLRDKPIKGRVYSKSSVNPISNLDGQVRTYTHKFPSSILREHYDRTQSRAHPTQKPVSLFKYLIETYTKPGDVVLDPFAGRGTTALACEELGNRGYICIERDPEYYSRALEQAQRRKAL